MLVLDPEFQIDDKIHIFLPLDGRDTIHLPDIQDPQAPDLNQVADVIGGAAQQGRVGHAANFNQVVRDQAVTPFDEFQGGLRFANSRFTQDQDTLAQHLDHDSVQGSDGRQFHIEIFDQGARDIYGCDRALEYGDFVFFGAVKQLRTRLMITGQDQAGNAT